MKNIFKVRMNMPVPVLMLTGALIIFLTFTAFLREDNEIKNHDFDGYKIIPPSIPDSLYFCGERVPVEDFEVKERMDRELIVNTYFHSNTILVLKRAHRWFPIIEPILKKNNVPDDMKYLAVIESNLTNAVSPAQAVGLWQFIEGEAKKYGLEINSEVDERYNVEKATEAACTYLKNARDRFGSWTLAAASYNVGVNGLDKQIGRQKATSYYNLVWNEETSRYIFRAVATKEIFKNPEKYGFFIDANDLYQPIPTYEIAVDTPISHLADFAAEHGVNYKILKIFNPWLRDNILTNRSHKMYLIKIPEKGSISVIKE